MTIGILNTSQFARNQAKPSFGSMILRMFPNGQSPLFGLTSMLTDETATAVEHGYWTKTMIFPQVTIGSGGQSASDNIFTATSTNNIIPGMVLRVEATGENVLVNAIISTTQLSVQRGIGTTTPAAISAAANLYQIGSAHEESSLRPQAMSLQSAYISNYTQIFRNTWAVSGSAAATQMAVGDSNPAENRQDCAAFHAADIEKALFFSQKYQGVRNGQPFHTMDGVYSVVSNIRYYPASYSSPNVTAAGATTNYTQLEAALDPCFNQCTDPKVANERVLFVGGTAKKVLNSIGRLNGTYQLVDGQTSFGLQFSTLKIARGTFQIIEHPLFNTNTHWSKMAVALDLSTFRLAYLNGRKTLPSDFNNTTNAAENGVDAIGGSLLTELTCLLKNPPANAIITNLTAAAAG